MRPMLREFVLLVARRRVGRAAAIPTITPAGAVCGGDGVIRVAVLIYEPGPADGEGRVGQTTAGADAPARAARTTAAAAAGRTAPAGTRQSNDCGHGRQKKARHWMIFAGGCG